MADQLVLVLVVAAVLVLLATLVVWVRPLLRPVRQPSTDVADPKVEPSSGPGPEGFGGPLAHGFGYLFSPLGLPRRRRDLGDRIDRALQRIGRVDPYATPRRIGLALLATGSPETPGERGPTRPPAAPAARPDRGSRSWPPGPGPADPRETGHD